MGHNGETFAQRSSSSTISDSIRRVGDMEGVQGASPVRRFPQHSSHVFSRVIHDEKHSRTSALRRRRFHTGRTDRALAWLFFSVALLCSTASPFASEAARLCHLRLADARRQPPAPAPTRARTRVSHLLPAHASAGYGAAKTAHLTLSLFAPHYLHFFIKPHSSAPAGHRVDAASSGACGKETTSRRFPLSSEEQLFRQHPFEFKSRQSTYGVLHMLRPRRLRAPATGFLSPPPAASTGFLGKWTHEGRSQHAAVLFRLPPHRMRGNGPEALSICSGCQWIPCSAAFQASYDRGQPRGSLSTKDTRFCASLGNSSFLAATSRSAGLSASFCNGVREGAPSQQITADSCDLLSAAPMMDHTTTHWRHLMSLMSRRMTLYTEMVSVPPAPLSPHGDNDLPAAIKRRLREEAASLSTVPNDVVLQVGAGTLEGAVAVARLLRSQALCQTGSEERSRGEKRRGRFFVVNLNCGCPSPRVASGSFGLLLMEDPARVADICCALFDGLSNATARISARFDSAMSSSTCSGQGNDGRVTQLKESLGVRGFQVSVKCRVGIEEDRRFLRSGANKLAADTAAAAPSGSPSCTYEKLAEFIASVAEHSPVRHFVVHARPGVLVGKLSPTENRSIPERRPEWVYRLCADFPHLSFTLNGGIESFEEAEDHLVKTADALAGIMVGRSLLEKPWYWGSQADKFIASQELRRRRCLAAELSSGRGGTTGARLARARREGGGVGERAAPGECTVRDNPGGSGRGCTRRDGEAKPARAEVLEQYARYADEVERNQGLSPAAEERQEEGTARLKFGREEEGQPKRSSRAALLKPLLNLFAGEPGSRAFKNSLQLGAGSSGASCSSEAGHRTAARGQTGARTNLGECGKQMLAPRGRGLQFPRTETAGDIIRKAMEVVPVDLLV